MPRPLRIAMLCLAAGLLLGGRQWLAGRINGSAVPGWSPFLDWLVCLGFWAAASPLVLALAGRFPLGRGRWGRNLAILAACGAALSVLAILVDVLAVPLLQVPALAKRSFTGLLRMYAIGVWHSEFITFAILVGYTNASTYYRAARDKERLELEMARLASDLNRAQLEALRMQLNPHFLFNALNTAAVLIHQNPRAAYEVLVRLSDLLRAAVRTTQENEVPLRREIEFLEHYLAIEKLRFQDRLTTRLAIDPAALDARVPIFLLQTLVENAVRHAVAAGSQPCTVEVRAARSERRLELQVIDDGPGLNGRTREGIGLSNTRERLARLYPDAHSFELTGTPGHGLTVTLSLPFHDTH